MPGAGEQNPSFGRTHLHTLLATELPVGLESVSLAGRRCGLVIVDVQNGFASVGAGALAPTEANLKIEQMVRETDRLARAFAAQDRPILVLLDWHDANRPEAPYPAHCIVGSGEEELVPALRWLESCPQATPLRADCINDFVGAIDLKTGHNRVVEWVDAAALDSIVVVGICTDICVAEFVATMLSARNHGMMPSLRDIVVYEPGCATYDLPRDKALALGLPETAAHPQAAAHHLGLYLMAARGARLASELAL